MSISFIAGAAGKKMVQLAIDKVFRQLEKEVKELRQEVQRVAADAAEAKRATESIEDSKPSPQEGDGYPQK